MKKAPVGAFCVDIEKILQRCVEANLRIVIFLGLDLGQQTKRKALGQHNGSQNAQRIVRESDGCQNEQQYSNVENYSMIHKRLEGK
jgi:hypothetical protein